MDKNKEKEHCEFWCMERSFSVVEKKVENVDKVVDNVDKKEKVYNKKFERSAKAIVNRINKMIAKRREKMNNQDIRDFDEILDHYNIPH